MSNYVRINKMEEAFEELYKIRPEISKTGSICHACKQLVKDNDNRIKISLGGRDVYITEILDRGLTKTVTLEHDGKQEEYKTVYEAEQRVVKLLKEK